MAEDQRKFEYAHYVLFPEVHYGQHSVFGDHIALGLGRNSMHIYRNRIFMGDAGEIRLTPEQTLVMSRIINRLHQKVSEKQLLEKIGDQGCQFQKFVSSEATATATSAASDSPQASEAESVPPVPSPPLKACPTPEQ